MNWRQIGAFRREIWGGDSGMGERSVSQAYSVLQAGLDEIEAAYALVKEYYEEVGVVAREDRAEFEGQYFAEGAGVWLAMAEGEAVGCVALRKLGIGPLRGEVKRMYVRSSHRGGGIAESLLGALEAYAMKCGYEWLYLDTADSMVAAARFYRRKSYEDCERYNENPQAALFMRKMLKANATTRT
jgi:GNAT superfamily N-acetyltransferase